jgi:hypothetical protein
MGSNDTDGDEFDKDGPGGSLFLASFSCKLDMRYFTENHPGKTTRSNARADDIQIPIETYSVEPTLSI